MEKAPFAFISAILWPRNWIKVWITAVAVGSSNTIRQGLFQERCSDHKVQKIWLHGTWNDPIDDQIDDEKEGCDLIK